MIMQQWQAATTTRHSYTHVSVPFRSPDICLGLELLRDIQFRLTAILNNSLASYDNNYVCHECIYVLKVGMATQKFPGLLRMPVAQPLLFKFLNAPPENFFIRWLLRVRRIVVATWLIDNYIQFLAVHVHLLSQLTWNFYERRY